MAELDDLFTGSLDNKMDFLNDEKKSVGDDGLYRIDLNKCKDKTKGWRSVIRFLPNVTKEGTIGQSAIQLHGQVKQRPGDCQHHAARSTDPPQARRHAPQPAPGRGQEQQGQRRQPHAPPHQRDGIQRDEPPHQWREAEQQHAQVNQQVALG